MKHWLNAYGIYSAAEIHEKQKEINYRKARRKVEYDKNIELIKTLYAKHLTYKQIGERIHWTRERVSGLVHRAIEKGLIVRRVNVNSKRKTG